MLFRYGGSVVDRLTFFVFVSRKKTIFATVWWCAVRV